MSINVASKKTISFRSPYTGKTFQDFTDVVLGRSGYLSGGATSDNGTLITVQPVSFVQNGIVSETLAVGSNLPVPTEVGTWYVIASVTDDDPNTGVTFTATADKLAASTGIVVAFKANGTWRNPQGISVAAALTGKSDPGLDHGFGIRDTRDASGNVTSIEVFRGTLTDFDGNKISVPSVPGLGATALSVTPARPHPAMDRNDHVVMRSRPDGSSSLEYLVGGGFGLGPQPVLLESTGGVTRPSQFAVRGGTIEQQWWAWSDGNDLRFKAGTSGAGTPMSAGATISEVWIVGRRTNGDVVILFVSSTDLYLVAVTPTGTLVGSAVVIEALGNQVSRARGVIDAYGTVSYVFQHNTGTEEQIYFGKAVGEVTGFGNNAKTPRIITSDGLSTGNNETWPSMGVDSKGQVTIANIQGTGSNQFGELVITKLDESGDFVSREVIQSGSDVGADPDNFKHEGGGSHAPLSMLDLRRTAVAVTPHDEVYYFTLGKSVGTHVDYILAGTTALYAQSGFKLINIDGRLTDTADSYNAIAASAGSQGEVFVAYQITGAANAATINHLTIAPLGLEDGRRGADGLSSIYQIESGTDASGFNDLTCSQSILGGVVVGWKWGTSSQYRDAAPFTLMSGSGHPLDTYIGGWTVPRAAATTIDGRGQEFQVFSTRPKRMNYPFLVGSGGSYNGYGSINDAIIAAGGVEGFAGPGGPVGGYGEGVGSGGEVIIRPGTYSLTSPISIKGGVSLRGEGRAVIVGGRLISIGSSNVGAPTVTGSMVEGSSSDIGSLRPGDIIEFATSGLHVVTRGLGYQITSATFQAIVDGTPVGAFVASYSSGIRIENLTLITDGTSTTPVSLERCYQPVLRNLRIEGDASQSVVYIEDCIESLVDTVDVTNANTDGTKAIEVVGGNGNIFRNVSLADGRGRLYVGSAAEEVHLLGCKGDNANNSKVIYEIQAGRSTPVYMTSCEGRVDGDVSYLVSNMGRRLRGVEGAGALELEDDNTRASTIGDLGIKLSSVTHKEFDGASKDVITDAVNERVLVAGDTMTGPLVFAAGDERVKVVGDTMTGDLVVTADVFAHRVFVKLNDDPDDEAVYIQGHAIQAAPLIDTQGYSSLRIWELSPTGAPNYRGAHLRDDFFSLNAEIPASINDSHVWFKILTAGGDVSSAIQPRHAAELSTTALTANAGLSAQFCSYGLGDRPGIRGSIEVPVYENGMELQIGFVYNVYLSIENGAAKLRWYNAGASLQAAIDLGVTPGTGKMYYTLQVLDDDKVFWHISSSTGNWSSSDDHGFITLGGNMHNNVAFRYSPYVAFINNGVTAIASTYVDFIESWAADRI